MSAHVAAVTYMAVGGILAGWAFDAHRRWLDALAETGELPAGGTELLLRGWLHPRTTITALLRIARASYPRTRPSQESAAEMWRIRRGRRFGMALAWMVLGGPLVIAASVIADKADSAWWLLPSVPAIVLAVAVGLLAYRFGSAGAPP